MTTTDIGILLIVLCVLLWAIMAALHRHTVQLEALKAQLQELLEARKTQQPDPRDAAGQHDDADAPATQASTGNATHLKRRIFRD